jgi:hypothetical protein
LPAFSHSHVCLKNCLLCLDCVCLSFHTTAVKSPLVVTQMSPCFSLWVLVWGPSAFPFYVISQSHNSKFYFWAK